jgi:hypothetical protein
VFRHSLESRPECAICGLPRSGRVAWFLITEHSISNTLTIWNWNDDLFYQPGVRAVCGQHHARELIVHWITTGSLHYPFAFTTPLSDWLAQSTRPKPTLTHAPSHVLLGELAIDRAEIIRVLTENPLWLNSMLDELMIVLEEQSGATEDAECEETATHLTLN